MPLKLPLMVAPGAFSEYDFPGSFRGELAPMEGRVLSRWGDAGWGTLVRDAKSQGEFGDDLVEATVEMIQGRWRPDPNPAWVTSIPSHRRPMLVERFARKVATRLGLPFVEAIHKVRGNEPQKFQQNRSHRNRNLDGVFSVADDLPDGPVLLVDDIVDSGWTLAVTTALLRQKGSGEGYPVALASATAR